jgi:prevent-host-death family protein
MSKTITQRELRNNSGKVLRDVAAGETVVVTSRGTPMAELRPTGRATSMRRDEFLRMMRGLPKIDAKQFRKDVDSLVDQSVE